MIFSIILIVLAFILILLLPHIKDKPSRYNAIMWTFLDIILAMKNLAEYYQNKG